MSLLLTVAAIVAAGYLAWRIVEMAISLLAHYLDRTLGPPPALHSVTTVELVTFRTAPHPHGHPLVTVLAESEAEAWDTIGGGAP